MIHLLPPDGMKTPSTAEYAATSSAYVSWLLTDANRRYGLSLMEHVESGQAWGVSAGVAPGNTVALKNGWLPFYATLPLAKAGGYQIDSIGWVRGHGRDYLLAVLTRDNPSMQYGIAMIVERDRGCCSFRIAVFRVFFCILGERQREAQCKAKTKAHGKCKKSAH